MCDKFIESSHSLEREMVSVSATTVRAINEVLMNDEQPLSGKNMLLRDLKNGLKVQKLNAQKDFLETCARKAVFPKDIISLAKSLSKDDSAKFNKEVRWILRDRISTKKRDIRNSKETWDRSTRQYRETVNLSANGLRLIQVIWKKEFSNFWN